MWSVARSRSVVVSNNVLAVTLVREWNHGGSGGRSSKVSAVGFFFRKTLSRAPFLSA